MEGHGIQITGVTMSGGNVEAADAGSLQNLDSELGWLEESLKHLEARIGPILSQYASAEVATPKPEPSSQIRGRVERLAALRGELNEIIERVDL